MNQTTSVKVTLKVCTYMDVELHVLPLAETSKFVTEGKNKTKQKVKGEFTVCGKQMEKLFHPVPPPTSTPICPVSPLNELLEDLPSQAVTDLHYVWLQEDRHINSSSGQVSLSNYVIKILCECM